MDTRLVTPELIEITRQLLPLLLSLLAMVVFTLYIYTKAGRSYRLKYVLIPTVLAVTIFVVSTFHHMLGNAYPGKMPDKALLLSFRSVIEGSKKTKIEIWIMNHTIDSPFSRLHIVPYSRSMEKKLEEAMKQKEAGSHVLIERDPNAPPRPDGNDNTVEDHPGEYTFRLYEPFKDTPKQRPEAQPQEQQPQPQQRRRSWRDFL